jgi:putative membrane protein
MKLSALVAAVLLSACEREITPPKMGGNDTIQAPMSTAQGQASPALDAAPTTRSPQSRGSFEEMTRDNPTSAGMPDDGQDGRPANTDKAGTASRGSTQESPVNASATAATLNSAERLFIARAGEKSQFEIQVSELAAERATDPALKSYAAMVAADHKGAGEELKRLAAGHGVALSQALNEQDRQTLKALQRAQGAAFDQQYLQTVGVHEHEKNVATFEQASADAQNPAVKDYVQSTLPTLKAHLDAARKLQVKG